MACISDEEYKLLKRVSGHKNHAAPASVIEDDASLFFIADSLRNREMLDPRIDGGEHVYRATDAGRAAINEYEQEEERAARERETLQLNRDAAQSAREANMIAQSANAIARESNDIAREAEKRAAASNKISIAAIAVSILSIVTSILVAVLKK